MHQQHKQYLSNLIDPQNNSKIWSTFGIINIQGRRQDSVGIGALKKKVNNMVTDSAEKAEILSEQFKSEFTVEDASTLPDTGSYHYLTIPDIDFTLNGVRNLLFKVWLEQVCWSQ